MSVDFKVPYFLLVSSNSHDICKFSLSIISRRDTLRDLLIRDNLHIENLEFVKIWKPV